MADKTLKSLNFGGADNYFPLPLVTAADNDKILSVVNGEWSAAEAPSGGGTGSYVWSKQFAGDTATGDTTGGTYELTTANDTTPSSEIEYSASAPTYNIATKKWEMADSTIVTLTNADNTVPSFSGNMYVRLTSAPNVWYLATAINVTGSGPYAKSLAYNAKYTAAIDGSYVEYVAGDIKEKYPDGGWSNGVYYTLELEPVTYLTFDGNEDFTLKTANTTKNWDGILEYSTDTTTWNTWDGTEISSAGSKLYLRGTGNTKITGSDLPKYSFVFTGTSALKIACKGNIENLLDYETVSAGGHPTMAALCYGFMFYNCTSLTTVPELPATTLANFCYYGMFYGCTSLTTVPELQATTLANNCYYGMFYGCTSLTTVPELPATTLANNCYTGMFKDCTNIKLSTTQTGEYQTPYRIPKSGTGTTATSALDSMFTNTGGTFTDTPNINTTYYLSTSNNVV